ncbi:hypothetical protein QVD17_04458 [Tagetes erecta]|uniref:Uncharacterized protein n=1 Tax=Tagetes erecta TaxID=13708 RepID=A0AAD8PAF6_TARER|nr:hypothetical protein QVD17_04458 [Tagetes erecta]
MHRTSVDHVVVVIARDHSCFLFCLPAIELNHFLFSDTDRQGPPSDNNTLKIIAKFNSIPTLISLLQPLS